MSVLGSGMPNFVTMVTKVTVNSGLMSGSYYVQPYGRGD
jgi:hypothetical protein